MRNLLLIPGLLSYEGRVARVLVTLEGGIIKKLIIKKNQLMLAPSGATQRAGRVVGVVNSMEL